MNQKQKNNDGKPSKEQKMVDRYVYKQYSNGKDSLISSAANGANFSTFRGLIPSMLSNLNVLNPVTYSNHLQCLQDKCAKISMGTVVLMLSVKLTMFLLLKLK